MGRERRRGEGGRGEREREKGEGERDERCETRYNGETRYIYIRLER